MNSIAHANSSMTRHSDSTSPLASAASENPSGQLDRRAGRALRVAAACWLGTAVLGQLIFAVYVAGLYGRAAIQGKFQDWNTVMPHGYVAGDTLLNTVLGFHLLFAFTVIVGGALQLLPPIRRRWPAFHRWSGRAYLIAAGVLSVGGLIMVWGRGAVGDLAQHVAISVNALLILTCAGLAWRNAVARRIDVHRRWALRLFLAVSGVWFFRIGLMLWIVLNQGPVGFDPKTFTGPFLTTLAFAQYLLPLGILELYFRTQQRRSAIGHWAMAGTLVVLTLATAAAIASATAIMWLPRL